MALFPCQSILVGEKYSEEGRLPQMLTEVSSLDLIVYFPVRGSTHFTNFQAEILMGKLSKLLRGK